MKCLLVTLIVLVLACLLLGRLVAGDTLPTGGEIGSDKSSDNPSANSGDEHSKIGTETDIRQDRPPDVPSGTGNISSTETTGGQVTGGATGQGTTTDAASSQPLATEGCSAQWSCLSSSFRALRNADCSFGPEEYCAGGCSNGECRQACKSCSADYAGQCGSFSDGCGGTLQCKCGSGYDCAGGKCCRKLSCRAGECGQKSNDCGQSVACGECEEGFSCNSFNQCILKQPPNKLEISNVRVFPYSTHAVITWQTSVEADSRAEFGETESLGSSASEGIPAAEHYVRLYGLKPETKYFFKVVSSAGDARKESAILPFTTTPWKEEQLEVLAILVSPESKTQPEGQAFSFKAITNSAEPEMLEFSWDFGDDSNALGERVFHSFYGLGLEKEKDFNVKVEARDLNGKTAGAEVKVKVLKAKFKALVLEPKQSETHSKEKDLNVLVEFLDENDMPIRCGEANARVLLAGKIIGMQCTDENILAGFFTPWPSVSEMELLEISADYNAEGEKHYFKTRVPVYFQPSLIEATDAFKGKKYFLNDSLENAKIRFLLNEIFVVFPTEIRATLVSGKKEQEVKIEKNEYDYAIYFDRVVEESDILDGLELHLEGRDATGNVVDALQEVPIVKDNPALTLAVLEPAEGKRVFAFGQALALKAKILSNNYKVKGKKLLLECEDLDLAEEMEFDSARQEYSTKILLPEKAGGLKKIWLKLTAYGSLVEKELLDFELVEITLSDILTPEFVLPSQGTTKIFGSELNEIKVRFLQPNGLLFSERAIEAELEVDGSARQVFLEFNEGEKLHKAALAPPLALGGHSLRLSVSGDFSGEKAMAVKIEQELLLLYGACIAGALLAIALIAFFLKNCLADRRALRGEKETLSGLEKKYKYEYFKRHITERELNEKTAGSRRGIESANALLKSRYWLYSGLLKTFCWKKDLKKCPQAVQAASLTVRLAGKSSYFSREEMVRAIIAEGHSEKVAEKVLEKIYGK